jgi:ribosomal protein S18 acetylase RimI-like enzyme
MRSLSTDFELFALTLENEIEQFSCGNTDLDEFFRKDAFLYQKQLLGQTYYFMHKLTHEIACAYTLSNDSLKVDDLSGSRRRKVTANIPHLKSLKSYPATLIGRLGVSSGYKGWGIGSMVLDFIKSTCITEDANKCRFIIVDAYNTDAALKFYKKNDFLFLWPTEDQEREYYEIDHGAPLNTRFMYFDLLPWANRIQNDE